MCPRQCKVKRENGETGFCRAGNEAKVALVSVHKWEEPCISGKNGAGTVFFSNCNMRCIFCQNYAISALGYGITVDTGRLAEIFLEQQARGVECLELVTPTQYAAVIAAALKTARTAGLKLTVVCNTNAYETIETIKMLAPYVDVFLPDMKYWDETIARKYSQAPNYAATATAAIRAMYEAAGPAVMAGNMLKKGVLVRHLILPWQYKDSIKIVEWLWKTFGDNIYLSLMNQYTPAYKAAEIPQLNRKLTTFEYQKVIDAALDLGIKNCFVQERASSSKRFIPEFNGDNVLPTGH
ncbi:radical SAM protein [Pectinatus frisingensis]|uniref:radical SAM protein n=1 Tax=Pectinatus frisingensis TaxID=865 RepID=UPI001E5E7005|nr:radical SAM protein [Pectinatus frisingensis]